MKRFTLILVLGLLFNTVVCFSQNKPITKKKLLDKWKNVALKRFEQVNNRFGNHVTGASFYLSYKGEVIDKKFLGFSNTKEKIETSEKTIYNWASITKTFTAIAIMQLRDEGKLKLDDPVTEHYPPFKRVNNPFGKTSDITIRQLLNHTSGLQIGKAWQEQTKNTGKKSFIPVSRSAFLSILKSCIVKHKPGTKMLYSNISYSILGKIIEYLTYDDFTNYITKNILLPLEMKSSFFGRSPTFLRRYVARSYLFNKSDTIKELYTDVCLDSGNPNAGLNASLPDLMLYCNFLMGVGTQEQKVRYESILKRKSLEEMFEAEIEETKADTFIYKIGLGFWRIDYPKTKRYSVYIFLIFSCII